MSAYGSEHYAEYALVAQAPWNPPRVSTAAKGTRTNAARIESAGLTCRHAPLSLRGEGPGVRSVSPLLAGGRTRKSQPPALAHSFRNASSSWLKASGSTTV